MKVMLEYKGYTGSVHRDDEENTYWGLIQDVSDLIMYGGTTGYELEIDFKNAVDEYIDLLERIKI